MNRVKRIGVICAETEEVGQLQTAASQYSTRELDRATVTLALGRPVGGWADSNRRRITTDRVIQVGARGN